MIFFFLEGRRDKFQMLLGYTFCLCLVAFSRYAARGGAGVFIPGQIIYNKSHLSMGGECFLGVTWWG